MRRLLPAFLVCACAHGSFPPAGVDPEGPRAPPAPATPTLARSLQHEPPSEARPAAPAPPAWRERVVRSARRHLGHAFGGDCSAFVRRTYAEAGLALPAVPARSASESLYRALHPVRAPRPGDLAFFHGSFDRDGGGRGGDRFTHVALVEEVDGAAVVLIHRSSRGIERLAMNLSRPHDPSENGWLRKRRAGDPPGLRTLSGELFAGYASAFPPEPGAAASR
jgi:hypothetical protein